MPHDVIMPALGMAQDTGLLVSWLKRPGDLIKAGDALLEIETDKAVMEVEAQADGYLTNVSAVAGDHVPVGQVVGTIVETADGTDGTDGIDAIDAIYAIDARAPSSPNPRLSPVAAPAALASVTAEPTLPTVTADQASAVSTAGVSTATAAGRTGNEALTAQQPAASAPPARATDLLTAAPRGLVLASPKARRLALEQGLSLERLSELDISEPYHVADLEALRELGKLTASPAPAALSTAAQASVFVRITARVPVNACDDFIDWMADKQSISLPPCEVWLRFATAALRQATGETDGMLIVETRQVQGLDGCFADADRYRFSQLIPAHQGLPPVLIVRDITASPITSVGLTAGDAAVLTVGREHEDFEVSFDYRAEQFDERQAMKFTIDFADRLSDPMLHLL